MARWYAPTPWGRGNRTGSKPTTWASRATGHIDRVSVSHASYWVLGRDSFNPLAGRPQTISAGMSALELSYTVDWGRFRTFGFWASGDGNARDGGAHGFDSILDNTNFGGAFSFFRRQRIPLGRKTHQRPGAGQATAERLLNLQLPAGE